MRLSPAVAGREWKPIPARPPAIAAQDVSARQLPGENGSRLRRAVARHRAVVSQPGSCRARMEAARVRRCSRRRRRVSARQLPGENGSSEVIVPVHVASAGLSPAVAGREWKRTDQARRAGRGEGLSPAVAGREWKHERLPEHLLAPRLRLSPAVAGREWKQTGGRIVFPPSTGLSPAVAGREWKHQRQTDAARQSPAVSARQLPGENGSAGGRPAVEGVSRVSARQLPGENGSACAQ